jgi:hypothetical protein
MKGEDQWPQIWKKYGKKIMTLFDPHRKYK